MSLGGMLFLTWLAGAFCGAAMLVNGRYAVAVALYVVTLCVMHFAGIEASYTFADGFVMFGFILLAFGCVQGLIAFYEPKPKRQRDGGQG